MSLLINLDPPIGPDKSPCGPIGTIMPQLRVLVGKQVITDEGKIGLRVWDLYIGGLGLV